MQVAEVYLMIVLADDSAATMKLVRVHEGKTVHYELQDDRDELRKLSEIEFANGVAVRRWAFGPTVHDFDDYNAFKDGEVEVDGLSTQNLLASAFGRPAGPR